MLKLKIYMENKNKNLYYTFVVLGFLQNKYANARSIMF